MTILIQSRPSNGAFVLTNALRDAGHDALRRRHNSTSGIRTSSFLVNWGCSRSYVPPHINSCAGVFTAVNKLRTFEVLAGSVRTPVSATALLSERNESDRIWLARTDLTGSGGGGIVVVRPGDEWPDAPLYVQYIPKLVEFRVHVFRILNETRTLVRQKLRRNGIEQTADQALIRNHDNGWVFGLVRDEVGAMAAEAEAEKALDAVGLDFAAVDVIIGKEDGLPYVLELNTAPGLEAQPVIDFYTTCVAHSYDAWRNFDGGGE